ncbi:cation-dependent mannose-6-phosphate receptor [Nematostella vectensis]|uniref:cation-dependent mannose-6-phosphate receptor n=1 Tax=Nematostella vectensis TaxID=45351 RepID=UPI0020776639|nr:cation-dependent mannose-6-phosphate receptor [Nematostella vectensis]
MAVEKSAVNVVIVLVLTVLSYSEATVCPQRPAGVADPTDVNGRIKKFERQKAYFVEDPDKNYLYTVTICKDEEEQKVAVSQTLTKDKENKEITLGNYENAQIRGGVDWFLISYPNGKKYNSHCGGTQRRSDVMVTCDPTADRGTLKIIEEYIYNSSSPNQGDQCYYLFEINNKAACTVKPSSLSPGSIILIVFVIVACVYLFLGFLYQRFIVGAKGMEQIPNYNLWKNFGSLQADGCNFLCRCADAKPPPRYKPMDDAIGDDSEVVIPRDRDDDHMLPM